MFPVAIRSADTVEPPPATSIARQALRFVLHSVPAYLISWFWAPWLAGRIYDLFLQTSAGESRMQFMLSHVFALTFLPGSLAGFINARYRHKVAAWVWVVPALVLVYKFFTFPASVLEDRWSLAFHYYFAGGFYVPEIYSYKQLFSLVTAGSDMLRGMNQLHVTGTFYAAAGYSLAAAGGPYLRTKLEKPEPIEEEEQDAGSGAAQN